MKKTIYLYEDENGFHVLKDYNDVAATVKATKKCCLEGKNLKRIIRVITTETVFQESDKI